jgi:protoporphyrinogen/coproporphyrinogen III oxidase
VNDVAIIGAGITGLTAAYRLGQQGIACDLYEKREKVGGAIGTFQADGYLIEAGPNTLQLSSADQLALIDELGLRSEMVEANPQAANRYIVKGSQPIAAPLGPKDLLKTSLFSTSGKLRLFREPFVRRCQSDDESLASFVRRRLGPEALDYAVDPFVGGIYAGDPERLSARSAFPKLWELEQSAGSLFRGGIRAAKARKRSGQPRFKTRPISFRSGLQALPEALAKQIRGEIRFNAQVVSISQVDGGWEIGSMGSDGQPTQRRYRSVILATPAHELARLPLGGEGGSPLACLSEIEHPPVASLALGFRREQIQHPLDGFGALVPSKEPFRILGALFSSTLFPGRAPEGRALLTVFCGGARNPEVALQPEPDLLRTALADLKTLLGLSGEPEMVRVTTWPRAIPQYNLGYTRFLDAIAQTEKLMPNLFIGGQARDGISLANCLAAGQRLANETVARLKNG